MPQEGETLKAPVKSTGEMQTGQKGEGTVLYPGLGNINL
jgi:hypothetical protein